MSLTLKSVSMLSSLTALRNMNKFTTTLTLSKESLKLLMLTMSHMLVTTTKGQLTQETTDTQAAHTVKTRKRSSATSTPRRTPARSPSRLARRLLTQSMLRSVRRESILIVRSPMKEDTTALELLIIIPRLLLLQITQDTMKVMEEITIRSYPFLSNTSNKNKFIRLKKK